MILELVFTETVKNTLKRLKASAGDEKRFKAVSKALRFLQANPRHPGLQTHKFSSLLGPNKEEVFEAYAEQDTPIAYRIFFFYGPLRSQITVIAITPHP